MKNEDIYEALLKHKKWLNNETDGKRLDLSYADLRDADLMGANLKGADLMGANLKGADLRDADLRDADLRDADLMGADLIGADLSYADLSYADLRDANLMGANLKGADLMGANLKGADLRDADLRDTNLKGADLRDAKIFHPMVCPEKGPFIGFKKANRYIIELEITEDALRSSATTRKCRCSEAKVISITNIDGTSCDVKSVSSTRDLNFIYTVGSTVKVNDFDTNRWNECTTGIHFFITREEAVRY